MAEEVCNEIASHRKALLVRRGAIRDYLTGEDLTQLLEVDFEDTSVRPSTMYKTISSHENLLKDKYNNYLKVAVKIGECVKKLEKLDKTSFDTHTKLYEAESDEVLQFTMNVEDIMSQLKTLKELCDHKMSESKNVGKELTEFQDHDIVVKEKLHRMKMEQEESDRKNRELAKAEAESQWKIAHNLVVVPEQNAPPPPMQGLKLHKADLPKFGGDLLDWQPFYDAFIAGVDKKPNYAKHEKLIHLRSLLYGIPGDMVKSLTATDANYDIAMKSLTTKYGQKELLSAEYRKHLTDLPPSTMEADSLERTQVAVEQTLQSLEANGETVNTDATLRLQVLNKFPSEVYDHLELMSKIQNHGNFDMAFIRDTICEYVNRKRRSEKLSASSSSSVKHVTTLLSGASVDGTQSTSQSQLNSKSAQQNQSQYQPGSGSSQQTQKRGQNQQGQTQRSQGQLQKREVKCSYCFGPHWNDECTKYPSINARIQQLQGRCYKCLRRGHPPFRCPNARICVHCLSIGVHHRSLCPQKFPKSDKDPTPNVHVNLASENSNSAVRNVSGSEEIQTSIVQHINVDVGEGDVLLQTANAHVRSAILSDKSQYHPVSCLLDSGAQRSFMLQSVADQANIKPYRYQKLELITFASDKPNIVKCGVARIQLKLIDGGFLTMSVTLVPYICKSIREVPVSGSVRNECKGYLMTNSFLSEERYRDISMLIGNDVFWKIVMSRNELESSDGLFLLNTKLGHILTGKVGGSNDEVVENGNPNQCISFLTVSRDLIYERIIANSPKKSFCGEVVTRAVEMGGTVSNYSQKIALAPMKQERMKESPENVSGSCKTTITQEQHDIGDPVPRKTEETYADTSCTSPPIFELDDKCLLENYWLLETIGITDTLRPDDEVATQMIEDSIRLVDGRYQVKWPWKGDPMKLPLNYIPALGQLKSVLKRIQGNEQWIQKYTDTFKYQLDHGIIVPVPENEIKNPLPTHPVTYIPHHFVINKKSKTTPFRIVFNASYGPGGALSLNACLYKGPQLIADLTGILLRWRLHNIPIVADVEKAFMQISLEITQQDVTRFLWVKDVTKPAAGDNLIHYKFARVPFGMGPSPFILAAVLKYHLSSQVDPLMSKIGKDIYVDNLFTGASNVQNAVTLYEKTKSTFTNAMMNLREWTCPNEEFNLQIPIDDQAGMEDCKMLGYLYSPRSDTFWVCPFESVGVIDTKRKALQLCGKVYDPLGLWCPATVQAKYKIQCLWKKGVKWDEALLEEISGDWNEIETALMEIPKFRISRHVGENVTLLACFTDASVMSYATTVYSKSDEGVNLVFAKSRLAPIKDHLTISRLELLGVLIGARSLRYVKNEYNLPCKCILWTDNKTVLQWLKSTKSLSMWVRNRVAEIKGNNDIEFRYISTSINPSDVASRGLTATELAKEDLWWKGPEWLHENESNWPTWNCDVLTMEEQALVDQEYCRKQEATIELSVNLQTNEKKEMNKDTVHPIGIQARAFSSWSKLINVTAYAIRFVHRIKLSLHRKSLHVIEGDKAPQPAASRYFLQNQPTNQKQNELRTNIDGIQERMVPVPKKCGIDDCSNYNTIALSVKDRRKAIDSWLVVHQSQEMEKIQKELFKKLDLHLECMQQCDKFSFLGISLQWIDGFSFRKKGNIL